MPALEFLD